MVFSDEKLTDQNGISLSPRQAKEMVRDALIEGGGLAEAPSIKKNCVRVKYAAGHHVDIPVYRLVDDEKELAGDVWRGSNPGEITDWFRSTEKKTHAEAEAEPQLRRLVRLVKRYSRRNLDGSSLSGLILAILTAEQHAMHDAREDRSLRDVLRNVRNRLLANNSVYNPANPAEKLTKDEDVAKVTALADKIAQSLRTLEILDSANCRRSQALKAWKEVLKADYFDSAIEKAENDEKNQSAAAIAAAPYVPKPWAY